MVAFYGLAARADKGAMMILDRSPLLAVLIVAAAAVAACSSTTVGTGSGLTCVDDSPHCVESRQRTLRYLVDNNDRTWIKAHPPAEAYASGVRLFAMQKKKKELSCEELKYARAEADKAPSVLRGPEGAKLTHAQVSRALILASEVSRELSKEMKRRC